MPPPWLTKGRHLPDGGLERVGLLLHLGARARRADLVDQPLQVVEEGAPCAGRTGVAEWLSDCYHANDTTRAFLK